MNDIKSIISARVNSDKKELYIPPVSQNTSNCFV